MILLIVVLRPTRVGSLGLVVAVVVGSVCAVLLNLWVAAPVIQLRDIVDVPRGLPAPVLPSLVDVPFLLIPAVSLAFIGLVQGAAVSAGIPTVDGKPANTNRDFIGQGAGNLAVGRLPGHAGRRVDVGLVAHRRRPARRRGSRSSSRAR